MSLWKESAVDEVYAAIDSFILLSLNHSLVEYTLALTKDQKVYAWGANDFGQLGVAGSLRYYRTPVSVPALDDKQIVQIAAGAYHSAALSASGNDLVVTII